MGGASQIPSPSDALSSPPRRDSRRPRQTSRQGGQRRDPADRQLSRRSTRATPGPVHPVPSFIQGSGQRLRHTAMSPCVPMRPPRPASSSHASRGRPPPQAPVSFSAPGGCSCGAESPGPVSVRASVGRLRFHVTRPCLPALSTRVPDGALKVGRRAVHTREELERWRGLGSPSPFCCRSVRLTPFPALIPPGARGLDVRRTGSLGELVAILLSLLAVGAASWKWISTQVSGACSARLAPQLL